MRDNPNLGQGQEEVTATLTRFEWSMLLRGGARLKNQCLKQIAKKPDWQPEPGKIDVNRTFIDQYDSALSKIESVWGKPLDQFRR